MASSRSCRVGQGLPHSPQPQKSSTSHTQPVHAFTGHRNWSSTLRFSRTPHGSCGLKGRDKPHAGQSSMTNVIAFAAERSMKTCCLEVGGDSSLHRSFWHAIRNFIGCWKMFKASNAAVNEQVLPQRTQRLGHSPVHKSEEGGLGQVWPLNITPADARRPSRVTTKRRSAQPVRSTGRRPRRNLARTAARAAWPPGLREAPGRAA